MIESFIRYIQFEKRYSPRTVKSYETDLIQLQIFLQETFELEHSHEASFSMLRSWVVDLVDKQLSAKSISRKVACTRSYYKFLLKDKHISKDPTQKLKAPKIKKKLPQFIEEDSAYKLLNLIEFEKGFTGLRDQIILETIYGTGVRLSELINLKESDINFFENTIKVLGKGNKERLIPINHSLLSNLKSYILSKKSTFSNNNTDILIVTNKGEKIYPMFVYRVVNKYLKMVSSVEKKSPHVLRHSFATHLLNNGADLNAIKELLGHSSLAATQVYTHNSLDKLKNIFNQAHPKA